MDKKNSLQILGMNIELTTVCPLRCPQCYCSLEGGKHIPLEKAVNYLKQAKRLGLQHVELSGGETLCYPHLYELIREANSLGIESNIAISGCNFDSETFEKLRDAGLSKIFVSLNAPTERLNSESRDGYHYAIAALELLKESDFSEVYINWVMHRNAVGALPEMIELAQKYNVKAIVILAPKPTSQYELNTMPTLEQMEFVARLIKTTPSGLLRVESCFSPLLAMASESKLLGNLNVGIFKGCGAGIRLLSVSVDGLLSPCRHLEYYEEWDSLEDYWTKSPILQKLRTLEENKIEPCASCRLKQYCRPCLASSSKLDNKLCIGNRQCPLAGKI